MTSRSSSLLVTGASGHLGRLVIEHLLYTSMPEPKDSPLLIAPDHYATEQALVESTLPGWTVLRNCWHFENLFLSLGQIKARGVWPTAAGDGKIAHIARSDLALAAATALAGNSLDKLVYTLTGSEAFTIDEIAGLISHTLEVPIIALHVPLEGLIQGMVDGGIPLALATVISSFDSNVSAGRVAQVTGDFQKLTGVVPQKYADWLLANQALIHHA